MFSGSFGLTAAAALVCVVLGFAAFVLWFFARLDREREGERDDGGHDPRRSETRSDP